MRDINRLDSFYDEVKRIHKKFFPDWRFGQLLYNFWCWYGDPFYVEEDDMVKALIAFAEDTTKMKDNEPKSEDVPLYKDENDIINDLIACGEAAFVKKDSEIKED